MLIQSIAFWAILFLPAFAAAQNAELKYEQLVHEANRLLAEQPVSRDGKRVTLEPQAALERVIAIELRGEPIRVMYAAKMKSYRWAPSEAWILSTKRTVRDPWLKPRREKAQQRNYKRAVAERQRMLKRYQARATMATNKIDREEAQVAVGQVQRQLADLNKQVAQPVGDKCEIQLTVAVPFDVFADMMSADWVSIELSDQSACSSIGLSETRRAGYKRDGIVTVHYPSALAAAADALHVRRDPTRLYLIPKSWRRIRNVRVTGKLVDYTGHPDDGVSAMRLIAKSVIRLEPK